MPGFFADKAFHDAEFHLGSEYPIVQKIFVLTIGF